MLQVALLKRLPGNVHPISEAYLLLQHNPVSAFFILACFILHPNVSYHITVGDMPKSPSSQYGLNAQDDIDPRGIMVTNGPMR